MNFRSAVLELGLGAVSDLFADKPINILEIGCMFKEDEGLSTLVLAEFLDRRNAGGRLFCLEYDKNHIHACKEIISRRAPHLLAKIEFYCGHSIALLPNLLDELRFVHFVSQDGGAHPEVCLHEFELLAAALARGGLIIVDDAQEIAPSEAYWLPRPLGKCTLILPYLLLANYLPNRYRFSNANAAPEGPDSTPDSKFIRQVTCTELLDVGAGDFAILGTKQRMLLYGNPQCISEISARMSEARRESLPSDVKSKIGRILCRVTRVLRRKQIEREIP